MYLTAVGEKGGKVEHEPVVEPVMNIDTSHQKSNRSMKFRSFKNVSHATTGLSDF